MADGDAEPPSSSEAIRPTNFLGYVAGATRVYRPVFRRVAVPFFLVPALLATAMGAAAAAVDAARSDGGLIAIYALQLLGLPFVMSLLAARAQGVMAGALSGADVTLRDAGRRQRGVRSHLLAAAAVAALLTFILLMAMGPVGSLVATHLFLGPTILVSVIVFERKSFQEGWIRTRELLRGHGMRLFLYLLCIALALVMIEVILSSLVIGLAVTATGGGAFWDVVLPFTGWILAGLGLSFMSAVGLVAYFDLRSKADEDFEVADLEEAPEEEREDEDPEEDEPEG